MIPWREQARILGRAVLWVFWAKTHTAWANITTLICTCVITVAIIEQLWLVVLAGVGVGAIGALLGRKNKTEED